MYIKLETWGRLCWLASETAIVTYDSSSLIISGIFIAAAGVCGAYPSNIALVSINLAGSFKRAAGMAVHIVGGNLSEGKKKSPSPPYTTD